MSKVNMKTVRRWYPITPILDFWPFCIQLRFLLCNPPIAGSYGITSDNSALDRRQLRRASQSSQPRRISNVIYRMLSDELFG